MRRKLRSDCLAPKMVGKRFGKLKVLALAGVAWRTKHRAVRVRCDCGKTWRIAASHLRNHKVRACASCAAKQNGWRAMIRLSSGMTLEELSRKSGVSMEALYQRRCRGWPEERLGEPSRWVRS